MTQKAFDIFIERILSHEGGYVNHPRDPDLTSFKLKV
ncbi:hypothetical protein KKB_01748 [Kingella kingae PYKK081]|nr:hypothetical protein KKB_01748 [Kingella kingae PYKK081]